MNLWFVLAVELYVHVWLRVWVYTHIYMLLKWQLKRILLTWRIFFSLTLFSVLAESPLKEKVF